MRTTLTIQDDLLDRVRALSRKLRAPFRRIINEAIRAGLDKVEAPAKRRRYRTSPHKMGLRAGKNLDNIQELLAHAEGEDFK